MTGTPNPAAMTARPAGWNVTVPPGTYFLGDPCYAVPDTDWMPLLNSCGIFEDSPVGTVRGHTVLGFGARWGDGTYRDTDGNQYPVDAGLIGLTPQALWKGAEKYDLNDLGQIVTFTTEQTASTDFTGLLVFGPHKIDTDPDCDEDDYR